MTEQRSGSGWSIHRSFQEIFIGSNACCIDLLGMLASICANGSTADIHSGCETNRESCARTATTQPATMHQRTFQLGQPRHIYRVWCQLRELSCTNKLASWNHARSSLMLAPHPLALCHQPLPLPMFNAHVSVVATQLPKRSLHGWMSAAMPRLVSGSLAGSPTYPHPRRLLENLNIQQRSLDSS